MGIEKAGWGMGVAISMEAKIQIRPNRSGANAKGQQTARDRDWCDTVLYKYCTTYYRTTVFTLVPVLTVSTSTVLYCTSTGTWYVVQYSVVPVLTYLV